MEHRVANRLHVCAKTLKASHLLITTTTCRRVLPKAVKGVDFTHGIKDLTATAEQRIRSERHFTSSLLVLEHTRSGLSQFKNPFLTNRDTETDSLFRRTRIPLSYVRVLVCTSTCPATISVNWWFCETATCNRVFLFFFFIKAHLE